MNIYTYKGIDRKGQVCHGSLFSKNEDLAHCRLAKRKVLVRELSQVYSLRFSLRDTPHFSAASLVLFTESLASLLESGVPLLGALEALNRQARSLREKLLIDALQDSICKGTTFSEALEAFPHVFNACYVQCVRAGEVGGALASVLRHLVTYLNCQQSLRQRIKRACVYPAAVLGVALVVVVLLFIGVIPRFERLFEDLFQGATLPYITRCVLGISALLSAHGIQFVAFCLVGIVVPMFFPQKRRIVESFVIKIVNCIPWLAYTQRHADLARWARIQGVLMEAGVPLLRSLDTSQAVVVSPSLQRQLGRVQGRVRDGDGFARSLAREAFLPPLLLSLMETGEKTGKLATQLLIVANQLENDFESRLSTAVALLEPLLVVFLALVVGTLVVALFLPMVGVLEHLTSY